MRKGRPISGIILVDKPAGITSNRTLQRVRRLYQAKRAGHTGNLDEPATGMLPVCLGQATKCSGYLLDADKRYHAVCRLGIKTRTGDMTGEVLSEQPPPAVDRDTLLRTLRGFVGEIEQVPPMYSALKHQGQRLYKLARQGEEVPRKARKTRIHDIRLLSHGTDTLELDVHCAKGTYIRTLAEDIGVALGTDACVQDLRRTASGPFREEQMRSLDELEERSQEGLEALDALLLPPEAALPDWPEVRLIPQVADYFSHGQAVMVPHAPTHGLLRVHDQEGRMIAIGEVLEDGRVAPRRLLLP